MNWKEQLEELNDLTKQEDKPNNRTLNSKRSRAKFVSRIERVIMTFVRNTDWEVSTDGWDTRIPTTFYLHPKITNGKPLEYTENQITIKVDFDYARLEIEPPSVLVKRDLSYSLYLPFSDLTEEDLAGHLKDIFLQFASGMHSKYTSSSLREGEKPQNGFQLGWYYSENKNEFQMAEMAEKDRATHLYVIGATGTGKTKFLEFLIQQDIEKKNGFGVIDPHGDLIEDIKGFLACYHENTLNDDIFDRVVLIDPTDTDYTVTFNPLEKLPNVSVAEQVGELVSSFKKIWSDSWGVRMEDLLRNSLIVLGEAGLPLTELPRLLTDRSFRNRVLKSVDNPLAYNYFIQRFNVRTDRGQLPFIEPVLNKINAFLADPRIRQMFTSSKSSFNFRDIVDNKKILLIKLDKGRLKGSADLLGSLLMAKIQLAAFSRSDVLQSQRTPFHLYIDEFQNFASESFMVILSEARKYGLSLTMAHQTLAQIPEEMKSLILGNAGIQVYFRVNRHDAQLLAKEAFEYSGYEVKTVQNLHPVFWTLGEEWEHKTEELQKLPPRCCYAKHKIEGGLIPLITEEVVPAWEELCLDENAYLEYIASLPIGKKYLVERKELALTTQKVIPPEKEKEPEAPPLHPEKEEVEIPQRINSEPVPDKAIEVAHSEAKEDRQHRYLQSLIKHMAEEKGYRAIIERPTDDGGRVDVGLEQNGTRIACEVSVTSTTEQEIGNIEKCLRARYDQIIVCCPNKKQLNKIRSHASGRFDDSEQEKLVFLHPEELFSHLEKVSAPFEAEEEKVKGYKVKVNYQPLEEEDQSSKREEVAQVILQSLKRQKEK